MHPLRTMVTGVVLSGWLVPAAANAAKKVASAPTSTGLAEARRLMAQGDYASACPKIAASQAQAPSPTTALTLAVCYEKSGKLATAWTAYKAADESATSAHDKKVAAAAKQHVAVVEPKLGRLAIRMPAAVAPAEVRCDGELVSEADWGRAIPRDAGGHEVEVTATGKKAWKKHVEVADDGRTIEVAVPRLEDEAAEAPEAAATTPAAETPSAEPARGQAQRIAGIAVAGVGVAVLGLGAFAGIEAQSTYHDALSACGGTPSCRSGSDGLSLRDKAGSWATVSTVSFIVGGAALAGGAVLFFTAPRNPSAPAVGVAPAAGGTGISVFGRF